MGKSRARSRGHRSRQKVKTSRVFISHASDDLWVARQMKKEIEALGAKTFLDAAEIKKGDEFKKVIERELPECQELVALLTPWSRTRPWVIHEIGMASMLKAIGRPMRIVCVLYRVTKADYDAEGGLGPLDGLAMVDINHFDAYLRELKERV